MRPSLRETGNDMSSDRDLHFSSSSAETSSAINHDFLSLTVSLAYFAAILPCRITLITHNYYKNLHLTMIRKIVNSYIVICQ